MGASTGLRITVIAVVVFVAGCNGGEEGEDVTSRPRPSEGGSGAARPAEATTETRCEVSGRPDYFVPKPEESPLAIIGCARLGVSRKPVEFSANSDPSGRGDYVCLNPAYREGGQLGNYIPAVCIRDPIPKRVEVDGVEGPREVQGYEFVIWGTAAPSTRQVVAHYKGAQTKAAVFTVRRPLARVAGATMPFSVFVVELSPEAACQGVLVRAAGASRPSTTRIRPRPKLCPSG